MDAIFSKLAYLMEEGTGAVLVTIVRKDGSAPRGAGSQMLVTAQGRLVGTIGGGPAEDLAEKHAKALAAEGRSDLHRYQLRSGGAEDIGSVCGGDITVLSQYVPAADPVWRAVVRGVLGRLRSREGGWLVQRTDGGTPALLDGQGAVLAGVDAPEEVRFALPLPVGERAVLFGAGHCALALAPLLRTVGFRVTVFDDRPQWANAENFPTAERICCGDFARISDTLELEPEDYVVVMTSGHAHDLQVEEQSLRRPLAYIGVIGSRAKTAAVNARLREAGISEEAIRSVHTPIGTDIKAVTPEEIAVSIAGEMICVRAARREAAGTGERYCPV